MNNLVLGEQGIHSQQAGYLFFLPQPNKDGR
jgi:hypothetical protein